MRRKRKARHALSTKPVPDPLSRALLSAKSQAMTESGAARPGDSQGHNLLQKHLGEILASQTSHPSIENRPSRRPTTIQAALRRRRAALLDRQPPRPRFPPTEVFSWEPCLWLDPPPLRLRYRSLRPYAPPKFSAWPDFPLSRRCCRSSSKSWSLTNTQAGWLAGIVSAGYMLAVIPLVSLTDRRPARQLYLASSTLSALSCFGMGLCDRLLPALGFRALAGIAMAGMYMPGLRALTHGVEGATRARIAPAAIIAA